MLLITLLVSWAMLGSISTPEAKTTRFVVAVGNNSGMPSEIQLRYAEEDASTFAKTLRNRGNVSQTNTILLTGKSVPEVLNALTKVEKQAARYPKDDVVFFFYYSGHGSNENLHIAGKRLALKELERRLARIKAGLRVAVIDACRSDSDLKYKGFKRTNGFAIKLETPEGITGVVTLKSSSDGEASQESESLKGAIFTHYLLTALRGAADTDRNNQVTLHEAYSYAYRQTVQRSAQGPGNVMHPTVKLEVEGVGDLVITQTQKGQGKITLPRNRDIKYLLYSKPSGTVLAEVWSDSERDINLHVPPGKYVIQRRATGKHGAYEFRVNGKKAERVEAEKFYPYPKATLAAKGGFLKVWHHELQTGYGAILNHHIQFSQRARLSYAYGAAMWSVGLAAEVGQGTYKIENHSVEELWVGGDLFASFRRLMGPLDLRAGAAWRLGQQSLLRDDADLLGNTDFSTTSEKVGFAFGPTATIGWRANLSPRWHLALEVTGHGWFRQEGESFQFRPEGALETSVGMDF
jgi:hypothetical protein